MLVALRAQSREKDGQLYKVNLCKPSTATVIVLSTSEGAPSTCAAPEGARSSNCIATQR